MTYCLAIKLKQGLVALADTRITAGSSASTKKKISIEQHDRQSYFMMTSGLRSVRDKTMNYFEDLENQTHSYTKLYQVVTTYGEQLKRVAAEDKAALWQSGLTFNLHTIIGGQLTEDTEPKLFLIYPEGNWVELEEDSPHVIIGNSSQGKAILNSIITADTTIKEALKAGLLSFESTRASANNVDYPIDVALYKKDSYFMLEKRYEQQELAYVSQIWEDKLKQLVLDLPDDWIDPRFESQNLMQTVYL
ncbi:peptidase [Flavobacterium faecale]|uniref:Peptidase n=1 Tax=Flavobacterium faecale TaxID=1355330 RepID=A0A2S1LG53_9FLAO|nr:peptidase [Flavobacterium faecale]AWG22735.1 peptidase [Flavobacterium faecale]